MSRKLLARINRICDLLEPEYGIPKPRSKGSRSRGSPLDSLIGTLLSQNTSDINSHRAFAHLRQRFPTWEAVSRARIGQIEKAIRIGGLSRVKAPRIRKILRQIKAERGKLSLDFLAKLSDEEAMNYLLRLPGVGRKTASCVLLFALSRPILPVDTHVLRVSKRLDLLEEKTTMDQAHHRLQQLVPPDRVLSFHLNLIEHGRAVCHARNANCEECMLRRICRWPKRQSR